MFQKKSKVGFADIAVSKRNIKNTFLEEVDKMIDWSKIEELITRYYNRGKRADGRPAYSGLLLFKICLLQEWYGVSFPRIEQMINDSVSLNHFLGLSLDDKVPSFSTVLFFKNDMRKKGIFQELKILIQNTFDKERTSVKKGIFKPPQLLRKSQGK